MVKLIRYRQNKSVQAPPPPPEPQPPLRNRSRSTSARLADPNPGPSRQTGGMNYSTDLRTESEYQPTTILSAHRDQVLTNLMDNLFRAYPVRDRASLTDASTQATDATQRVWPVNSPTDSWTQTRTGARIGDRTYVIGASTQTDPKWARRNENHMPIQTDATGTGKIAIDQSTWIKNNAADASTQTGPGAGAQERSINAEKQPSSRVWVVNRPTDAWTQTDPEGLNERASASNQLRPDSGYFSGSSRGPSPEPYPSRKDARVPISPASAAPSTSSASAGRSSSSVTAIKPETVIVTADNPSVREIRFKSTSKAQASLDALTDAERDTYNRWFQRVSEGDHPKIAAKAAGDSDYELIDDKYSLFSIRLSLRHRVYFTFEEDEINITSIGTHI